MTNVTALKGMPLKELLLYSLPVADLTPLQGMPLTNLVVSDCRRVTDMAFVKGRPLESFTRAALSTRGAQMQILSTSITGLPAGRHWE